MPFLTPTKIKALVASQRCCCICHVQCGVNIECHHIVPEAEGGSNRLENCIPLCFNCHADVQHYNDKHPRGNKFSPKELRQHRDSWFERVKNSHASPPSASTNDVDHAIFEDFRERLLEGDVNWLQVLMAVSRPNQAACIRRLEEFVGWGSSLESEFIDADLESWRAELVAHVRGFLEIKNLLDNLRTNCANDRTSIIECVRDA
jgi:hypothetical protein